MLLKPAAASAAVWSSCMQADAARLQATDPAGTWAERLQTLLYREIPLSRAMAVTVAGYDAGGLTLTAPLAPNINDKGTAFGGSLSAVMTLAGWGTLWIACQRVRIDADIMIQDGAVCYQAPVASAITVRCAAPEESRWEQFLQAFRRRGRGRIDLSVHTVGADRPAATMDCRFAVIAKHSDREF